MFKSENISLKTIEKKKTKKKYPLLGLIFVAHENAPLSGAESRMCRGAL
jgi:hypothetical protein